MSKVIKLKQSDIEKIVTNIINEDLEIGEVGPVIDKDFMTEPGSGKEKLKLGFTKEGNPVLYKTNPNGEDELVKEF
jgi:hypothetical protein